MRATLTLWSLPGVLLLPLLCYCTTPGPGSNPPPSPAPPDPTVLVIPTPQKVNRHQGWFSLSPHVTIHVVNAKDPEDQLSAAQLEEEIQAVLGSRPQRATRAKGSCIVIGRIGTKGVTQEIPPSVGTSLMDSLGTEGYVLHVSPNRVVVAAGSGAGVFYGVQTLKQLIRANKTRTAIPCATIIDWPALRYRGWMHDISRGPIPSMDFLKKIIVTMAEYKQNSFTLYTEHVFRLKSHPDIAPADGISTEEIMELSSFAAQYHIELIGNAQSFGHMENILASPFYSRLRENNGVVTPAREETYTFLKDMYAEIVPSYKSKLFHINCDEVTGLGSGPARRMVDSAGAGEVYAYHINRICDLLRQYGKRVLLWGDIAVGNPQIIDRLPEDLVIISWGYHTAESFDEAILPFTKTGFDFMVAPGVSCWGQVWPHMSNAVVNISNYVRDGAKLGAMGMMNTVWVDDGENLFSHNWHGLLWGAECSWNPARPLAGDDAKKDRDARAETFNRAFDALFFGTPGITETLFLFDSLRTIPVRNLVTNQGVWSPMLEMYPDEVSPEAWKRNERVVQDAGALQEKIGSLRARARWNTAVLDAALFAAQRVLFTGRKNLARIAVGEAMQSGKIEDINRARALLADLLPDLHRLKAEYARLWQRENRSWWLHRVLEKYDRLGNQLLDLDKIVLIEPENAVADGKRRIVLKTAFADQAIYYTSDGSDPTLRSARYQDPFPIDRSSLIRARVFHDKQAYPLSEKSVMAHKAVGRLARLNSRYSLYNPAYAAGGEMALLDGVRGSENFSDGRWQGYQGQDLDIVLDLQVPTEIRRIRIGLLQQSYSWILMPARVQVWTSADGINFELARDIPNTVNPREEETIVRDVEAEFQNLKTRFVRIVGMYPGKLPAWHHSAGNDAFIFADEIVVE